jgi:pimeloyl-ACP methyl ester carboxylesterase
MNSSTSLDVIARYLRTISGHNRKPALAQMRDIPVLVLCGDRDLVTPADHSREIAKALPSARLVIIPEGGHVALLEHADKVNEYLGDLLSEAESSPGPREERPQR